MAVIVIKINVGETLLFLIRFVKKCGIFYHKIKYIEKYENFMMLNKTKINN